MSKYLKYFTESVPTPYLPPDGKDVPGQMGSRDIIGVGGSTIFNNIIVKNPAGSGLRTGNKKPTFGLGFDLPASLATQVMDVMRAHGDKDAKTRLGLNNDIDDTENKYDEFATWQDINQAVGNYVRSRVNTNLKPYKLGAVPLNPASNYDGLDTTKMGLIATKPSRTKVKINPAKY